MLSCRKFIIVTDTFSVEVIIPILQGVCSHMLIIDIVHLLTYFFSFPFSPILFTLLYFTLLYFTLLYFTLLYFTLLYFTYCTLLYFTLLYFTILCFTFFSFLGALTSPKQNGSAYVLLHHVMGEAAGKKGVWAYVEGNTTPFDNETKYCRSQKKAALLRNFSKHI